ncbi:MAG: DUF389 domain-containing protein [Breznakibacter sp.]
MNLMFIVRKFVHYFNLESELDNPDRIHEEIIKGIVFKGTNLWILVFAIIVASVGLNMNSTAVIIGAMLISPLMGPINGMGYSIATYNYELFKQSIKNFSFAVLASLIASTTYFALSPIATAHSELLARTSPTIYDVMIAFFGGLAGIVAISSKHKGNVIPGVAIATALMPPLCTAGYGLATTQFDYFFGAIYLFTINTVFIAIASVVISQILKFPIRTLVDKQYKQKVNRWISVVILIVLLPSIYFGYGLVQKEKFNENANRYITNVSTIEGNFLLKSDINVRTQTITLIYGGLHLSGDQKAMIIEKASTFNLQKANIIIQQGLAIDNLSGINTATIQLREEISNLKLELKEKDAAMGNLIKKNEVGETILKEINALLPQIEGCTYAETFKFSQRNSGSIQTALVLFSIKKGQTITPEEKEKIENWLQTKISMKSIKILYE